MAYTPPPAPTTGGSKTGENADFAILGNDPLSAILATLLNQYGKAYYGKDIVGKGVGEFTIKERYEQVLAMGTKYKGFRDTFGALLRNWDPNLGGSKANYTASNVASLFRSQMEAAAVTGTGKTYPSFSNYLWDTAPPAVTDQFKPQASTTSTGGWADAVLKAAGIDVPKDSNAIANLQRMITVESAGNQGGWLRDNNPLNYDTWTGAHAPSTIAAKYGGKIVTEFGIHVMVFPTEQDGINATAEFIRTQQPSVLAALKDNVDAAAFGTALQSSAWSGASYANPTTFASVAPYVTGGGPSAPPSPVTAAGLAAAAVAATVKATATAIIGAENTAYLQGATQTKDYSSYETVHNELYNWGLEGMARWAFDKAQKGEDPIQIVLDLRNTPQYAERFPGLVAREKSGLPPITENQYIAYQNEMMSYANTIALPKGFITPKEIGTLIANDVSPVEFNQRLQALQTVALKSDPQVRSLFNQYFGVRGGLGALTAYFADPHRATGLITQQVNTAQIGAEAINSGFGALSRAHALELAQDEESGHIAPGTARADIDRAANQEYLTAGAPGSVAPRVTKTELLGAQVPGYAGTHQATAQQQVRNAESAREAPLEAGGGAVASARGVRGAGSASTEGAPSSEG